MTSAPNFEAKYGKLVTAETDHGKLYNDSRMAKEGWAGADVDAGEWENMDLPKNWEQAGLDIDGIVWFRKLIDLPQEWAGKDLLLEMTPIDDYDITFFNGQKVGGMGLDSGSPWQTPRVYTIPGLLVKAGKNVIAVRVFDTGGGGGITSTNDPMRIRPKDAPAEQAKDLKGSWRYHVEAISAIASSGEQNNPARLYNAMIEPIARPRSRVRSGIRASPMPGGPINTANCSRI